MKKQSWYKLGIKALVFLILVIIVDFSIGRVFDVLNDQVFVRNPKSSPADYLVKALDSDIIIIGASTAQCHYIPSIIEDSLKMNTYNSGLDGTPFIVQNALLNLMLDRYQPKIIVWEIGEVSMEIGDDSKHISYLYPYYDKNKQVKEIIDKTDCFQKYRMISKTYRNNSTILDGLKNLLLRGSIETNPELKGYLPLDSTGYAYPPKIHKEIGNTLDCKKIEMLKNTIERCNDLRVLVCFSFSPKYLDNYAEIMSSAGCKALFGVAKEYNIPVLDFYTLFPEHPQYFKDNAHLNERGAKEYMEYFVTALKRFFNG